MSDSLFMFYKQPRSESVIIYKLADVRASHINLVAEVTINTTCWLFGFTIIFLRCLTEVGRLSVVQ